MKRIKLCLVGIFALTGLVAATPPPGVTSPTVPWWDDFPTILQSYTYAAAEAVQLHANALFDNTATDPTWGIYAQRLNFGTAVAHTNEPPESRLKVLTYFEGFGTCESYIAQLKRNPDGSWVKRPDDPTLTLPVCSFWNWQRFDGTGEIRWIGLPDYFEGTDFAQPWTHTHPRYSCPPMTYPDGRVATGYNGDAADPRNSRVFDAGCSKSILGTVMFDYVYNKVVNLIPPGALKPQGPITGLLRIDDAPVGPPDPGYTPEEWKKLKKSAYAGIVSGGKDTACPVWIDYLRASVRQALDAGVDGLWVDNYSPWDSFGAIPLQKAFGDWSVAGFRDYLRTNFSTAALVTIGVTNVPQFDIRQYLQTRCRFWGGKPDDLTDSHWLSPDWRDDAIWRAYLIYKRRTGTAALTRYYHTVKDEAAAAGKKDFLVMGNDIPVFSLGWVRGDLDMVSTEFSWDWGLTTGPRGVLPPPQGSYVPVYKLAREHAQSRFVNMWMYVPQAQLGKTNIARLLYYQGLANHALPLPHTDYARTAGNPATDAAFFGFVRQSAPTFGNRVPVEEVGVYYSSSSQLLEMLPGGFRNHASQPHIFAFWGWGTALTQLHVLWRAVPEWKVDAATLRHLRVLIIPNAEVFDAVTAKLLEQWVCDGGSLIVTGNSGARLGESGNFDFAPGGSTLSTLVEKSDQPRRLGKGVVFFLNSDPGLAFYQADKERPAMLGQFGQALAAVQPPGKPLSLTAPEVPTTVGLTLYHSPGRLFVDVNNTDIDLEKDTITPAAPLQFTVTLPPELSGRKLHVRILSPDAAPGAQIVKTDGAQVTVKLGIVTVYASVVIEGAGGL